MYIKQLRSDLDQLNIRIRLEVQQHEDEVNTFFIII